MNLTFDTQPIEFEWKDGDVLIHCKGMTGTLSQVDGFMNEKSWHRHYFGECKIRNWRNHQIKIDCLQDSKENFKFLYEQAKLFKNEWNK